MFARDAANEQRQGVACTSDAVLYDTTENGVAILTFNRPDRLNAWGADIAGEFFAVVDRAVADPRVRVLVVTGAGPAFCAGVNLRSAPGQSLGNTGAQDTVGSFDVSTLVGDRHPHFLTELPKPVIAAINGACAGIGLTIALMCDVRFAASGAKFSTAFARRGLIAEYAMSWILPRLVGWGAASDLLLSGRTFLAEEATQLGLVKETVAPDLLIGRALQYAEDIALHCSPRSLAEIKRQLYRDATGDVVEASARADVGLKQSLSRPDVIEGVHAFHEKRRPNFPDLP
jgi:enoyl-CoA hydratase/carnithine racemase